MLFVEFRFFVFFLVVFCVHWALRSNTARKVWLLLCSHFFYACFFIGDPSEFVAHIRAGEWASLPKGWWFPTVLWGSTCMDYIVGRGIGRSDATGTRRGWLLVSLGVNLGVLSLFKYYNFFISSFAATLAWIGLPASDWTLEIILPFGISFYVFQSISYSVDVYRRRMEPVRSFLDLAFFISFFPQLVAGPIVRAATFLPQVSVKRVWANVDVRGCLTLFFIGFVKKACVSENVARYSDTFFADPGHFNHLSAWIGVSCYAIQIYCDFSGYTDMAIAVARLLGYELTVNFNYPYFADSITDFWRRWHISLSTWLRDYLYITLGGSRGTKLFTYRNLMLTMLLGGLWHGASWNFVIWGGLHGAALVFHKEWMRMTAGASAIFHRIMAWLAVPLTFAWICITWVFFRAQPVFDDKTKQLVSSGTEVAKSILGSLLFFDKAGRHHIDSPAFFFVGILALVHWMNYRGWLATWWRRVPDWAYAALLGIGVALALLFVPTEYKPFIYFQF